MFYLDEIRKRKKMVEKIHKGVKEFKVSEFKLDAKIVKGDAVISVSIPFIEYPALAQNVDVLAAMVLDVAEEIMRK